MAERRQPTISAWPCAACNGHKHARTHALDPASGVEVPLFDPRRQRWHEHFSWSTDGTEIIGQTSTGRATIAALRLNDALIVAARTTNGIDRLMDYQDRVLYARRYLHGTQESGRWAVRAMALQWNFHPYSAQAQRHGAKRSPFEALNGFQYHDNWLHNLLSAASMGGRRL